MAQSLRPVDHGSMFDEEPIGEGPDVAGPGKVGGMFDRVHASGPFGRLRERHRTPSSASMMPPEIAVPNTPARFGPIA